MSELDGILRVWNAAYRELNEAFQGLADHNLWKRPGPNLISIGEIAGHMAHVEAMMLTGAGPSFKADVSTLPIKSWLLRNELIYPPTVLEQPPIPELSNRKAREVLAELQRIHQEALQIAMDRHPVLDEIVPGWHDEPLWGPWLSYGAFHAGYHVGQIYVTRHLLGESTPDN